MYTVSNIPAQTVSLTRVQFLSTPDPLQLKTQQKFRHLAAQKTHRKLFVSKLLERVGSGQVQSKFY